MATRTKKPQQQKEEPEEEVLSEEMEDMKEAAIDLFWKGTVKPGEPLVVGNVEEYFIRITNACLGPDASKGTRTSLTITQGSDENDESPGIICTLTNQHENHRLNLVVSDSVQLGVAGEKPSTIYLVGYLAPADQFIGEAPFDLGSDMEDIDDDVEMKENTGAKKQQGNAGRKRNLSEMEDEAAATQSAAKKQKAKGGQGKPAAQAEKAEEKPAEKKEAANQNNKNQKNQKKNEKPTEAVEAKEEPKAAEQAEPAKTEAKAGKKNEEDWKKGPEGLKFKDLRAGEGKVVKKGSKVTVFYVGQLPNKKIFDKQIDGDGFEFKVGGGEVIQGWEKGLIGMKVGGKRRLLVPAKLAYGEEGSQPDIPPNTDLTFTIEIKTVN